MFEISDPEQRYSRLGHYLDLPAFHSFMAAEILTHHFDGYTLGINNYRLLWPRGALQGPMPSGLGILFIPHGTDQMGFNPHSPVIPPSLAKAARAVLLDPHGRAAYLARFATVFTNCLDPWSLSNRILQLQDVLQPEFLGIDPAAARAQAAEAERVMQRIFQRHRHLREYFDHRPVELVSQGGPRLKLGDRIPLPGSEWFPHEQSGDRSLFRTNHVQGVPVLVVNSHSLQRSSGGSWRIRTRLPAGKYRLEGRVHHTYSSQLAQMSPGTLIFQVAHLPSKGLPLPAVQSGSHPVQSEVVAVAGGGEEIEFAVGLSSLRTGVEFDTASLLVRWVE